MATFALLCLVFAACSKHLSESGNSSVDGSSKVISMRIVTDDLDRRITVPVKVNRIVSLAPSVTESVFAVGAGDRLVGDTTYCNYPEEAKAIQKVGDTLNPNMETIVALKPDVVFVSGAYVMNPKSLDEVVTSLNRVGNILGTDDATKNLVDKINNRRIEIGDKVGTYLAEDPSKEVYEKRVGVKKVFVQISREPLFTIGKSSYLNQVITEAGGKSATADVDSSFPKLSKETAFTLNPDVIILSDSTDNKEPNEVFNGSPAVKNGRVYKINADILSRPGPRLVDALEQIAKDLHPEKFQ